MKKHQFTPVQTGVSFPEMEEKLLKDWYEQGVVDKYLHRNDGSENRFSFLDGPITANNPMGVHHAWGRTYKDLWQRYHTMKGFAGRYQNGFDCQGLWVEVEVEKELGIRNKRDIENLVPGDRKASIAKFVELCKARVRKFSGIQTEQSKRLGYFMDWDHSYYTMSDENNYMIWHFLKTCHKKGWIYKGKDSVPWCPRCQTAISQHEMLTEDYKEVVHKAIYFKLPIMDREREYLLVWTTTPWTIPANIAVAVDPKMEYSLVRGESGDSFWLLKDAVERVFRGSEKTVVRTVKGSELVGWKYRGPFDGLLAVKAVADAHTDVFHTVVATDPLIMPITAAEGTGIVHTAVSAGAEDFRLGKLRGLPMIPVIDDEATYIDGLGFLTGQNAKKHPEIVLDYLNEQEKAGENWVFLIENYKHRYPACWRCKTELVWKVTEEWYIAMDVPENGSDDKADTLREQMKRVARMIDWRPSFGLDRELDWLSNMHDWLISKKNRYWGLALPIYDCPSCGRFHVVGSREELKELAETGWQEFDGHTPHKPYIDDVKIRCPECGKPVSRIDDVGNVWLDAGIVPYSTYVDPDTRKLSYTTDKSYWQKWFPADFITESFPGQFKNWFYSMIAMSTVLEKTNPYRTVLGYGSMLGEDGRPMHKSWGNAIEFNEGAAKMGADVMRWMFVTHNPEQNLLFGYRKADETRRKFHLLLWNVYNFFVTYALVDGWTPNEGGKTASAHVLDRWILSRLSGVTGTATEAMDRYDAATAANTLETFVSDLSQWYVRRSRDRVGPTVDPSEDKQACYRTLYTVLVSLSRLLAPFVPFLSESIYTNLTGDESVHLADWPVAVAGDRDETLEQEMQTIRRAVEAVHAKRKAASLKVRQPLAKVTVSSAAGVSEALYPVLADEVNVKNVEFRLVKAADGNADAPPDVQLDTELNDDLRQEGQARELVRNLQALRKEKGCAIDAHVTVELPETYKKLRKDLVEYIKRKTLADDLVWTDSLNVRTG